MTAALSRVGELPVIALEAAPREAGRLTLAASFDGRRTVVDTLRQEGLSRCSRPFSEPGGGARVVTSQFGPGFVRGDRFAVDGRVGPGATLDVVAQSAARAVGAGAASRSVSRWRVAEGGTLRLLGEPLVAYDRARHESVTQIELTPGASFALAEVALAAGDFASLASRLRVVDAGGALLLHDAWTIEPAGDWPAVGSGFYLVRGLDLERARSLVRVADRALDEAGSRSRLPFRAGADLTACGGVAMRLLGDPYELRATIVTVLARLARSAFGQSANDR